MTEVALQVVLPDLTGVGNLPGPQGPWRPSSYADKNTWTTSGRLGGDGTVPEMTPTVASERTGVRLAELVAALSLGVDLGFGQPMEHVLRQSLIALRLAERLGLDEADRSVVYYAALLVNVGCHSDAHEQAKWFGDDIALKSTKYDYELGSLRQAIASMRLVGSGNPPLHRFRVGLEFALSGHREIDGTIARHAALAGTLAAQLGLSIAVQEAIAASYEQWDGHGWPGKLRGEQVPIAARLVQLSEFAEVAHRIGGVEAAVTLARARAGSQFDPALSSALCADAGAVLSGLDSPGTWEAVIAAEPALTVTLSGEEFDNALLAVANFVDLKSPYTLGHARAVADLAQETASQLGMPAGEVRNCTAGRPRARSRTARCLQLHLGQTRLSRPGRMGTGANAPLPDRTDAPPVGGPRPPRGHGRRAPRAPRRVRLPPRSFGRCHLAPRTPSWRGRRLRVDVRTTPIPLSAISGRGRRRTTHRGESRPAGR